MIKSSLQHRHRQYLTATSRNNLDGQHQHYITLAANRHAHTGIIHHYV
jgi:hypothetical protein